MEISLDDRMKMYEKMVSSRLMPSIPACARIDGRSFHAFTKGLERPYDTQLSNLMIETTKYLVKETNARIGYTQSDEISLIWLAENAKSEIFFNGRVSKMASILAAMSSVYFNRHLSGFIPSKSNLMPIFDARVWNVPNKAEAVNYLIWREDDATKNSISMAAQSFFSHKQLFEKNSKLKQEMLFQKGINWNNYPSFFKRGTYVQRQEVEMPFDLKEIERLPEKHEAKINPNFVVKRQKICIIEMPPIRRVANAEAVVFEGANPVKKEDCQNELV